jgi:hypothetical protein
VSLTFSETFLLADDAGVRRFFTVDPAVNAWLLIVGAAVVFSLVFALYRAQRRMALPRLVGALTGIRLALIAMVFSLLLRPLWVWQQKTTEPPALWVLVDQSLSMAQKDQQASPIERLRWADALGLLPPGMQRRGLDRQAAILAAVRDRVAVLGQPIEGRKIADSDVAGLIRRAAEAAETVANDPVGSTPQGAAIVADLRTASTLLRQARSEAGAGKSPPAGKDSTWSRAGATLDSICTRMRASADAADEQFLREHSSDRAISQALAKVAELRRSDLLYRALTGPGRSSLPTLLNQQRVKIIAFGTEPKVLAEEKGSSINAALKAAAEPIDSATDLAAALRRASEQIADGEPAAVLVASDGRVNAGPEPADAAQRLAWRGVPVFGLAVGSRELATDAAVDALDAPDWVYKDDAVRIAAALRLDGLAGKSVDVELLRDGTVVDTQKITPNARQASQTATFTDKPPGPGVYSYEVRIPPVLGEAVADNNSLRTRVAVKKDKLQVLVIENEPRWEYRYLVNYLKRDARVHLQSVLLEPARVDKIEPPPPVHASATNETDEAQLLPASAKDWSAFDLIVLGDVPPEALPVENQNDIAKAVRERGTALAVIAGPLNMPARYAAAPLAELLPVQSSSNWDATALADHIRGGFRMALAPQGSASSLGQLAIDPADNARIWSAAPDWFWHSEQTQAKPAASVLWQIAPRDVDRNTVGNAPDALDAARGKALLATMPLGAGRVIYLAGDATWRLRQVEGENLHERFWGQLVRWASGSDLPAGGRLVHFGVDKPRAIAGEDIQVSARVLNPDLTPWTGEPFQVVAQLAGKTVAEARMRPSLQSAGFYQARLGKLPPGDIELHLSGDAIEKLLSDDPDATQKNLTIEVLSPALVERQNINADPATLASTARAGGGLSVDGDHADLLSDLVPNTPRQLVSVRRLGPFGDPADPHTRAAHWIFLSLFVGLITAEWLLRKAGGLV